MENKDEDDKNEAYVAKKYRKDEDKDNAKGDRKCRRCEYCKKKGHFQDHCFQLHPELKPKS